MTHAPLKSSSDLRRCIALVTLGLVALATPNTARSKGLDFRSQYEAELIRWALAQAKLAQEPEPAGKVIERVVIVRENIIADSDPWPNFLNWVHIKSRESVVRQELLIREGEVWDEARVAESARNLRNMLTFAVAQAIPCRSERPGQVILLVVTKDLWSIRMNMVYRQTGSVLEAFDWTPSEENFLGRNKRLSLRFRLRQYDWSERIIRDQLAVGQSYVDRRLFASRLMFSEWAELNFAGNVPCAGALGGDRFVYCPPTRAGDLEGMFAQLQLARPLYSLATKWGFNSFVKMESKQVRSYRVNAGATVPRGEWPGLSLRTDLLPGLPGEPTIPRIYDLRVLVASASVTRSFGREVKQDATLGTGGYSESYKHPDGLPFSEQALAVHAASYLPRSEDALYSILSYHAYTPRYVRLRNVDTFALTEDFQLGPRFYASSQFGLNLKESAQSYLMLLALLTYRWHFADNILTVYAGVTGRMQQGLHEGELASRNLRGTWANQELLATVDHITAPLLIGRLHTRILWLGRNNTLSQTREQLGGVTDLASLLADTLFDLDPGQSFNSVMRGYSLGQFEGDNLVQINVEYRSRPINLFTVHFGFVLFYDGGAVYGGRDPAHPDQSLPFYYKHGVGLGARALIPQLDKETFRADFGVPLTSDAGSVDTWFSLSFKQVF